MIDWKLPPLAALRAFEAAARSGGLSAAARELNVTHAAVAQHIKRLEEWFETPLLRRAGRGMQVTPAGEQFASELGQGFLAIRAAVQRMAARQDSAPLRITTTPAFASSWLLPRLESFYRTGTNTEVVVNPTTTVFELENYEYDVAFRFGQGDWPGMVAEMVVPSGVVLVGARSLLSRHPVPAPADLVNVPWVEEFGSDEVASWLGRLGVVDRMPGHILSLPAEYALSAIKQGRGVGIVAAAWIEAEIASGELVVLFDALHGEDLGYHLVYPKGRRRPALERFLNWCRAELGRQ